MTQNSNTAIDYLFTSNESLTPRKQQLFDFLKTVFQDKPFKIVSLPGDASFRCYHRVYLEDEAQPIVYIVMDAPPEKESVVEFVAVAELFTDYINVPNLVAKDMDIGFLVLQDFGQTEFAHMIDTPDNDVVVEWYQKAIDTLCQLQVIDIKLADKQANIPHYDAGLLNKEMDLFFDWFLPYLNVEVDASFVKLWDKLKSLITEQVSAHIQVVVHRDYHSRNLMLDASVNGQQSNSLANSIGVIDFQDAVIGSYTYDLVSLLRDAYASWDESLIESWIDYYLNKIKQDDKLSDVIKVTSRNQFLQDFNIMGLQRHLKVLGIFIRLAKRDGKNRYLSDIPKVMNDLLIELTWLTNNSDDQYRAVITEFNDWLQSNVLEKYNTVFVN